MLRVPSEYPSPEYSKGRAAPLTPRRRVADRVPLRVPLAYPLRTPRAKAHAAVTSERCLAIDPCDSPSACQGALQLAAADAPTSADATQVLQGYSRVLTGTHGVLTVGPRS